jgi:hypothetical protein
MGTLTLTTSGKTTTLITPEQPASLNTKEVSVIEVIKEVKVEVPVEIIKEIKVEVPVEVIKEVKIEVPVEIIKYVDREVIKEVEKIVTKAVEVKVVDDKLTQSLEAAIKSNEFIKDLNVKTISAVSINAAKVLELETKIVKYKMIGLFGFIFLLICIFA